MRLIQIFRLSCLLIILVSPVTVYAAQPSGQIYGPVAPKETLSEIAQRVRGEWRIPLKYVVQAMYELNPQAFSGSIGTLHLGSTLAIPDMKALSEEVPELLANKPIPPASRRPTTSSLPPVKPSVAKHSTKTAHQQKAKSQQLSQQQLNQIDLLITSNQNNIDTLEKLIRQVNASQETTSGLQRILGKLQKQQKINMQRIQQLEQRLPAKPVVPPVNPVDKNLPFGLGQLEFYLLLLTLPTLLALIAIFLARRPAEPAEIFITETPDEPAPHPEAVFQPETISSEPSQTQDSDLVADAADTQHETIVASEETESPADEEATSPVTDSTTEDKSPVEDIPEEELYTKGESTAPIDSQEPVDTAESKGSEQIDIAEDFMTLDEASELEKTGDVATVDIDDLDDIQKLKTAEDEIEAKLSFAYLHIDMGDNNQAEQTLAEIDLAKYPNFTDKVNEIRAIIEKSNEVEDLTDPALTSLSEATDEQSDGPHSVEFELDIQDEPPEVESPAIEPPAQAADSSSDTAQPEDEPEISPDDKASIKQDAPAPKLTALEKVLKEQFKLANTYNNQGKLDKSKSYIAKILRHGTPEYRQKALALLQDIESKELAHKVKEQIPPEQAQLDSEQTIIIKPSSTGQPAPAKQSTDPLLATGVHEIIPRNLSDRFTAYSENEEGTKLTLAYLFLDLDEVDTATQLLEEVLESGDQELVKEAEELLEQLVVF